MIREYQRSGRVGWMVLLAIPVYLAAAVTLGLVYQFVLYFVPILAPMWTLLAAVGLAITGDRLMKLGHVRSGWVSNIVGLVGAGLLLLVGYIALYAIDRSNAGAGSGIAAYLHHRAASGIPIGWRGNIFFSVGGFPLKALWVLEALVFLFLGSAGAFTGASAVYCERCRSWASRRAWRFSVHNLGPQSLDQVKSATGIKQLCIDASPGPARAGPHAEELEYTLRGCRCGVCCSLDIVHRTSNAKGERSNTSLRDNIPIDGLSLQTLLAWSEKLDPNRVATRPTFDPAALVVQTVRVVSIAEDPEMMSAFAPPEGRFDSRLRSGGSASYGEFECDNTFTSLVRKRLDKGQFEIAEEALRMQRNADDMSFVAMACSSWRRLPPWLEHWAESKPDSPCPHLVRGIALSLAAGDARGTDFAPKDLSAFLELAQQARAALHRAAELAPRDPTPWAYLVQSCGMVEGFGEQARAYFEQCIARSAHHTLAHIVRARYTAPHWGGGPGEGPSLAREASRAAPPGRTLHVVVPRAHFEYCHHVRMTAGDEAATKYLRSAEVQQDLRAANARCFKEAAHRNTMITPYVRAHFAFTLWKSGLLSEAAEHLTVMGTSTPWFPFGPDLPLIHGKDSVVAARKECGVV